MYTGVDLMYTVAILKTWIDPLSFHTSIALRCRTGLTTQWLQHDYIALSP